MNKRINNPLLRTTLAEALILAEQNSVSHGRYPSDRGMGSGADSGPDPGAGSEWDVVTGLEMDLIGRSGAEKITAGIARASDSAGGRKSDSLKVSRKRFQALVNDRTRLLQQNKTLERETAVLEDDLLALRKRYGDLSAGFLEISECYFSLLGLLSQLTEIRDGTGTMDQVYALVVRGAEAFFQDEAAPFTGILKKKAAKATVKPEALERPEEGLLKKGLLDEGLPEEELTEEGLLDEATDYGENEDETDFGEDGE